MRTSTFKIESFSSIALLIVVAGISASLFAQTDYRILAGSIALVFGLIYTVRLAPKYGIYIFFTYLSFEGPIRMFSHYHDASRLAADLLLIVIFVVTVSSRFQDPYFNRVAAKTRNQINIFFGLLLIFWLWVVIQTFNPWGLGLFAVVVSMKAYVVPTALFIITTYFAKDKELEKLPFFLVGICLLHAIVALLDISFGIAFWPMIEPFYLIRYETYFFNFGDYGDATYRPYGLTPSPSMPQLWMVFGVAAICIAGHTLADKANAFTRRFKAIWYTIIALSLPLLIMTLLVCQVRTAMLQSAAILCTGLLLGNKWIKLSALALVPILLIALFSMEVENSVEQDTMQAQLNTSLKRAQTLGSVKTLTGSRHGAWKRILLIAEHTIMGLGVGRGSVHQGIMQKEIDAEGKFRRYGFSDNVYNFLFLEVGLFGMLAWTFMLVFAVVCFVAQLNGPRCVVAMYILCTALGSIGSESPFPQPVASMFWVLIGWAMRYPISERKWMGAT